MNNNNNKSMRCTLVACLMSILPYASSFGSAFSLYNEINGSAVGNYAAGIAAEYSDASTGWSNPAGLAFLHHDQVLIGGVGVFPYAALSGHTLYTTQIPEMPDLFYGEAVNNLITKAHALIPSFHLAHPLGPNTSFGLSVVSPFGLSTDWGTDSPFRYGATYTKLITLDISPEIGGRFTDHLTGGIGLDLQEAYVTFNQVIGAPAVLAVFEPGMETALDSVSTNTGDSFGVGFHAGLLAHFNEQHSRLGVNYQSPIKQQFYGTSQLTGGLADPTLNIFDPLIANPHSTFSSTQLYSNAISLPGMTTFSFYQDMTPQFALLGSLVYTGWSSLQAITLNHVAGVSIDQSPENLGQVTPTLLSATTLENYRDTWRFALGANFQITPKWMVRLGGGYEQTPTVLAERDVRLPDANRMAASVGGHYQLNRVMGFDAGYSHYFLEDPVVNKTNFYPGNQFNVQATGHAHANLLGAQVVLNLD